MGAAQQRIPTLRSVTALSRLNASPLRALGRFVRNQPLGAASAFVILAITVMALFAPWIAPFDPDKTRVGPVLQGPTWSHFFGTDGVGRDVFSRTLYGGRISLKVGILAVLGGTFLGTIVGLLSGYFGGLLDLILQRIVDTIMAIPILIMALGVVAMLGPSTRNLIITVAIVMSPNAARVVRSAVLSVKPNMYIDAARSVGATNTRILVFHVLPNVMEPILIVVTVAIGNAILLEASLSFLGLGTAPPTATWGNMINSGRDTIQLAPWIGLFPGAFLTLAILGFNLFGDSLRDVLDPRLRGGIR